MPDIASLEGYIGETYSALLQLSCLIGGAERSTQLADACGHAGMAIGLAKILNSQAYHRDTQRVFIPLEALEKHGFTRETWLAQDVSDKHLDVISHMHELTQEHLVKANAAIRTLPKNLHTHFLSVGPLKQQLRKISNAQKVIFERPLSVSPLSLQMSYLKTSILGI